MMQLDLTSASEKLDRSVALRRRIDRMFLDTHEALEATAKAAQRESRAKPILVSGDAFVGHGASHEWVHSCMIVPEEALDHEHAHRGLRGGRPSRVNH
jgi:hypothetical protein